MLLQDSTLLLESHRTFVGNIIDGELPLKFIDPVTAVRTCLFYIMDHERPILEANARQ